MFSAKYPELAKSVVPDEVDMFVKNSHHLRVLRGKQLGVLDRDMEALSKTYCLILEPRAYVPSQPARSR